MKKILMLGIILVGVVCITADSFAGPPCGPGPCHWGPGPGPGWHGGYRGWNPGPAAFWTNFGLECGVLATTTAIALRNPPVVYAAPTYVTSTYVAPTIVTVPAPAPTIVVQQPLPIITQNDYIETVVIIAPNGTQMSIQLKYANGGWIGPKGEIYRDKPSAATLSTIYCR